jgi:hypothetical protein
MATYRVIADFLFRGQRISAPGRWDAPSVEVADRLVAAGCIKPTGDVVAIPAASVFADSPIGPAPQDNKQEVTRPEPAKRGRKKGR